MKETAYAKINLALHVRRRREDGYHELETLFAFVDAGDVLSAALAAQDSLHVVGEFAATLSSPLPGGEGSGVGAPPFDNLVARALNTLPRPQGFAVTLEKNLPVAAGLGGGSADAGAVFRIVEALQGLPDDWQARAANLGADVPACVLSRTHIGLGTGTEQLSVEDDLAGTPVLLVNPRVPLSTGPVFKAWASVGGGADRGALPDGPASRIAREGRNDLEAPAISLCGGIAEVLAALQKTDPWLARMSGSGATCFALYDTPEARDAAQAAMPAEWWTMAGRLR
jgi:4-diphosphocytidyl-2-C-methyl-D-erythritol kinase